MKRLIFAIFCVGLGILSTVRTANANVDPRKVAHEAQVERAAKRSKDPIPKTACAGALKLMQDVHLQAEHTPLADVLKDLEAQTGVQITADYPALAGIGVNADTPITVQMKNVTLESALALVLRRWPAQCRMSEDGKSLIVSTPAVLSVWKNPLKAQNEERLRQALLSPVTEEGHELMPCVTAANKLAKKAGIPIWLYCDLRIHDGEEYDDLDELDEEDESMLGKTDFHFQNISLDSALKCVFGNFDNPSILIENECIKLVPPYVDLYPSPLHDWAFATEFLKNPLKEANEAKIRQKLDEKVDVSFEEIPYADAIVMLGELHDIPIWISRDAIDDNVVSLKVTDTPLKDAFDKLLQSIDMCGLVQNESYRIVYNNVDDEWYDDLEYREEPENMESEVLFATSMSKTLFPCQPVLLENKQAEEILHRPVSLTTEMSSLFEDLQSLAKQANVGLILDAKEIDTCEESVQDLIYLKRNTFQLSNVTLESALRLLLADLELDFSVQNGAIRITSHENATIQNESFRPQNRGKRQRETAIIQVLEKDADLHLQNVPLRELISTLQEKWNITILLDEEISPDTSVSFGGFEKLPNMLALELALRPLELEARVRDETLQIVTEDSLKHSLRFNQLENYPDTFRWNEVQNKLQHQQRKMLNQRITFSMTDVPLREALQTLSTLYGFVYCLNEASLSRCERMPNGLLMDRTKREAKGLPPGEPLTADERISFEAKNKRLHSVISDILRKYHISGDMELGVLYLERR